MQNTLHEAYVKCIKFHSINKTSFRCFFFQALLFNSPKFPELKLIIFIPHLIFMSYSEEIRKSLGAVCVVNLGYVTLSSIYCPILQTTNKHK